MVVERASQKSLRLTAIDSAGQIKIFLAMVSSTVDFTRLKAPCLYTITG